jgi:hypothetical protein
MNQLAQHPRPARFTPPATERKPWRGNRVCSTFKTIASSPFGCQTAAPGHLHVVLRFCDVQTASKWFRTAALWPWGRLSL